MATPLEKARKDPGSMKAKILKVARRVFGEYGFHGTTTRMIAQEVGIDISTLHYHWGDKADLYEAVILDISENLRQQLTQCAVAAVDHRFLRIVFLCGGSFLLLRSSDLGSTLYPDYG